MTASISSRSARFPLALRPGALAVGFLSAVLLLGSLGPARASSEAAAAKARVAKLVAVLQSNAPQKDKADACRELARIGTKDAVPALAALLGDPQLSHMARYGLETIPSSAVDKAFRAALATLHGRELAGVLDSIGVRRDTGAVKALGARLGDPDPEVAQAAARALGNIAGSAAAKALRSALHNAAATNQPAVCEGLLRCADSFSAKGPSKKAMAIYDLLRPMPLAPQIRLAAWRGAILSRGKKALPLLLEALDSTDYAPCAAAIRTSQELPGREVTLALAGRLPKLHPADRQVLLARALGRRGDIAALPALFELAASKGAPEARLAAIGALPQIGYPTAVPVLLELIGDSEPTIAQAARDALGGLPGPQADNAVMNLLARGTVDRRITGMQLAVRRRLTSALPELFIAAEDLEPRIRTAALQTLAQLGGAQEIPAVFRLLERASNPAAMEAVEQTLTTLTLKAQNPQAIADRLAAHLAHEPVAQQCALLRVLTAIGGSSALKAVRTALASHEPDVHVAAIRALSSWNSPEAAPELLELARVGGGSTDQMLCMRGYLRLAGLAELPAQQRLAMCRQATDVVSTGEEKDLLLADLGAIPSLASLELIDNFLGDSGCKEAAAAAAANVSAKLLEQPDADKLAPKLIPVLEKIEPATSNTDLAKRARALLEEAQGKAGAKSTPRL